MAKVKAAASAQKVTFGVRKPGKAKKRLNKHDGGTKPYRGQGK